MRSAAVQAAAAGCLPVAGCGGEPAAPAPQSARPDRVTVSPGPDGMQAVSGAR